MQGPEVMTASEDYLVAEPRKLLTTIDVVLNAYQSQKGRTSMLGQTAELMEPSVIERMKDIKAAIERRYI
jgi:hypothetical protein